MNKKVSVRGRKPRKVLARIDGINFTDGIIYATRLLTVVGKDNPDFECTWTGLLLPGSSGQIHSFIWDEDYRVYILDNQEYRNHLSRCQKVERR